LQINAISEDVIEDKLKRHNTNADVINKFKTLFNQHQMNTNEVKSYLEKGNQLHERFIGFLG